MLTVKGRRNTYVFYRGSRRAVGKFSVHNFLPYLYSYAVYILDVEAFIFFNFTAFR